MCYICVSVGNNHKQTHLFLKVFVLRDFVLQQRHFLPDMRGIEFRHRADIRVPALNEYRSVIFHHKETVKPILASFREIVSGRNFGCHLRKNFSQAY